MSWYRDRGTETYKQSVGAGSNVSRQYPQNELSPDITLTIRVLDMTSREDYEMLAECLLELPGVVEIGSYQGPKILRVSYRPGVISVEYLVFTIARLGYHYVQRA